MDPLVELLLELGARAKTAERSLQAASAKIAELEAKVAELTPAPEPTEKDVAKEVAPEPPK